MKTQDGRETAARLCWVWLPKPEAEKARARAMRDGVKNDDELLTPQGEQVGSVTTRADVSGRPGEVHASRGRPILV